LLKHPDFSSLPVSITIIGESGFHEAGTVLKGGKFSVHGVYQRDDLPALLERYKIAAVMIPSVWPETFSFTTSEALLLGYPVITFSLGAQGERVSNYECGVVVDEVSAEGMIKSIRQIIEHPELIEEMSRRALQYAPVTEEEHFSALCAIVNTTLSIQANNNARGSVHENVNAG
jgi:glycosyltransferase involved in cell wall biosynthesis